jgi:hypothetical protein
MTKKEMEEMVQVYKDQAQLYREQYLDAKEQMSKLQEQVFRLQDGLMSVRAPEAYNDFRADNSEVVTVDKETIERNRKINDLHTQHIHNIEGHLFTSADDMMRTLGGTLWEGQTPGTGKSIHGNDES